MTERRKRKGSFLNGKRMLAVLLAVALTAGMVSNTVPIRVLAQEDSSADGVSGNDAEPVQEETEPAAEPAEEAEPGETKPEEAESGETEPEEAEPGETESGETEPEEAESGKAELEEAESGKAELEEAEPGEKEPGEAELQEAEEGTAEPYGSTFAATAGGTVTESATWGDGTQINDDVTIQGGSRQSPLEVTVSGNVTISRCITVQSGCVKFTGGGSLNWSDGLWNALVVAEGADVVFENVTLDGSGAKPFSRSALLLQGTVTFGSGTRIQNFSSTGASGSGEGAKGVIAVYEKGNLTISDGAVITGNQCDSGIISIYQLDSGSGKSTASVAMLGGAVTGNTVNNANLGVIWNWCGNLTISGGTVTAEGNEYAVHTQGNGGRWDATTEITGGTFTGNSLGAVCAGEDSSNNSKITITGGTFRGKTAATVNYGEIDIKGGSYEGSGYALSTTNGSLNVSGGEFCGGSAAYSGNVTTTTDRVIVGESRETAANWDKTTKLNDYKYVAIGELAAMPGGNLADGVDWVLDADGKLTIRSDLGMQNWFNWKNSTAHDQGQVREAVIADGVTELVTYAFSGCSNMTSVTMPDTVTRMGGSVFMNCKSLSKINLSGNLTNIGNNAFQDCSALTQIEIPNSVQTIENNAFNHCTALKGITIPASVTKISYLAFYQCSSLASVTMLGKNPPEIGDKWGPGWNSFRGCPCVQEGVKGIHVPADTAENGKTVLHEYKNASDNWNEYKDHVTDGRKYAVTVTGGTGSGSYEEDDTVTIAASVPVGKEFAGWEVNSGGAALGDPTSAATSFTMPAGAVSVTATYQKMSDAGMVSAAKTIVEDALKGITATNETTKAYVQSVLDAALSEAGITDVTVTVENFTKTDATKSAEGSVSGSISISCGTAGDSVLVNKTIAKLPGIVVKPGNNAPAVDISTPESKLKDMLLTDGEKQGGINISIVLEIQDGEATVSEEDKAAARQALQGRNVGQYLDVELYKLIEGRRTDITKTPEKVRIVITVPEALRNKDSGRTRTFVVIRVHDGKADLLSDVDDDADTITIETDRFSTYAIAYQDVAGSGGQGDGGQGGSGNDGQGGSGGQGSSTPEAGRNEKTSDPARDNEPKTGDAANVELYATLAMIFGFTWLFLYVTDKERGMTEETKKELVSRMVAWAKRGGRLRRYAALAAIFCLLAYYHSMGKRLCMEWKEVYGK